MRLDTGNTRAMALPGDSSTTSMKAAVLQGPRGEQGLPGVGSTAWVAAEAVTIGTKRRAPDGSWIQSTSSRTTRGTFDATEATFWVTTGAVAGTLEARDLSATIGDTIDAEVPALAALAATPVALAIAAPAPGVDILGDSITNQNGGTRPSGTQPSGTNYGASTDYQSRGFLIYAMTLLGWRARFGLNFGVSGQQTSQILARIADVLASPNRIVVVYGGINDIGNGVGAATTKQNLLSIYQQLRAAGKTVIAATIGSSIYTSGSAILANIASGVSAFSAPSNPSAGETLILGDGTANAETVTVLSVSGSGPYTVTLTAPTTLSHVAGDRWRNVTRLANLRAVNQWIIDYCRGQYIDPNTSSLVVGGTDGIYLVDFNSLVTDPTSGQPYGSLQSSGTITTVAQNPLVRTVDGTHPGQDLAHLMGLAVAIVLDRILPPLPIRNSDNTDAGNLLPNGRGVGNSSGQPTGWSKITSVGTFTMTPSKVTRTDGVPGEKTKLSVGPGNTGGGQERVGDVSSLTFNGTDAYVLEIEFETEPDLVIQTSPPGGSVPIAAVIEFRNGGGSLAVAVSHFAASGSDGVGSIWDASGVLRTTPIVPPATANRILVDLRILGVDTGTVYILSARVRKVTA